MSEGEEDLDHFYLNSFPERNPSLVDTSNVVIPDCRLCIRVNSVDGLPFSILGSCLNYCTQRRYFVEITTPDGSEMFSLHAEGASETATNLSNKNMYTYVTKLPGNSTDAYKIWNYADYFGRSPIVISIYKGSDCKTRKEIGSATVLLRDLYALQMEQEKSRSESKILLSNSSDASQSWLFQSDVDAMTVLPNNNKRNRSLSDFPGISFNILTEKAKSATTVKGTTAVFHELTPSSSSSVPHHSTAIVNVRFEFRLIVLQRCFKANIPCASLRNHALSLQSSDSRQLLTEFHLIAAKAPANVLVEVMKILAWKGYLTTALTLLSSSNLAPLEVAVLEGNAPNVFELLRRSGMLCFSPVSKSGLSPGLFHLSVLSGSTLCFDYISRFLNKCCKSAASGGDISFASLLEWRDSEGLTPLMLASALPNRGLMVEVLLSCGVEIASVNSLSGKTSLMYACELGNVAAVRALLFVMKSPENDETELTNHSSRRSLFKGRKKSKLAKGYNSKLALYSAEPSLPHQKTGKQAIHFAVESGSLEIVTLLMECGVSCLTVDNSGSNIFHLAAKHNHLSIIKFGIEEEANRWKEFTLKSMPLSLELMDAKRYALLSIDNRGQTPLDLAFDGGFWDVVKVMVDAVIDIYGQFLQPKQKKLIHNLKRSLLINKSPESKLNSSLVSKDEEEESLGGGENKSTEDAYLSTDLEYNTTTDDGADNTDYLFALTSLSLKSLVVT